MFFNCEGQQLLSLDGPARLYIDPQVIRIGSVVLHLGSIVHNIGPTTIQVLLIDNGSIERNGRVTSTTHPTASREDPYISRRSQERIVS
jgi:hypothetical protein